MGRMSKVDKAFNGDLEVSLDAAQELEVLKKFRQAVIETAEIYTPYYKAWRSLRDKMKRGKVEESSEEFQSALAARNENAEPLKVVLKHLCTFALKVSPANVGEAYDVIQSVKKYPAAIHAMVMSSAYKKWERAQKKSS